MSDGALDLRFPRWPGQAPRTRSLWIDEALAADAAAELRSLEGEQRADVCIVGGGFTGLWTAVRLLERAPSLRVTIVEADLCGSGASGRNSGGTGHWWSKLPALIRLLGPEDAKKLLQASVQAVDDIHAYAAQHRIACELRHAPSVWSTTHPRQAGPWAAMFKAAYDLGLQPPHRSLSAEELRAMFGKGPYYSGIVEERATRMQPARLARELRRVALGLGAQVLERSPVRRISSSAAGVSVEAGNGRIVAAQIVLAANAWMAHLPAFRSLVTVVSSDIVATDPIPELLRQRGLAQRPAGVNSRLMLNYGGLTPDGRVYLGRGGGTIAYANRITADFDRSARQSAEVEADFRYLYPELSDVPIPHSWAGPIDRAPTGLPWFGHLPEDPRVHYGIGYSGHGVGASALGGRILASQLLDADDEWADLGACLRRARRGHYPPEPLRSLAGHAIRRSVVRKEQAERQGREGGRVDRLLAGFANASLPDRQPSA